MGDCTSVRAVVLCAGRGKRLGGGDADLPKCLRPVLGRPLLGYILDALDFLPRENIILIVGYKKEEVLAAFPGYKYAVQDRQLGTAHAVECAEPLLSGFDGTVLVTYSDMPLLSRETFRAVADAHLARECDCTVLAADSAEPLPFGRVICGDTGDFIKIVEARDATADELAVRKLNVGVYAFNSKKLFPALKKVGFENDQKEKYLTDAPGFIRADGGSVAVISRDIGYEILGVSTVHDLERIEAILSR